MAWSENIVLDGNKDPLDLRDLMYEGSLVELPPWIDNRGKVPYVLDQGEEGACTGFALAAVVNFLRHTRAGAPRLVRGEGSSPRMLYEMAKRYDEWEGEDYEGSSIRAAMKAWYKHGVCRESVWPNKQVKAPRFSPRRQQDALATPLGNYYRVRHLHLSHMHSALAEVGILYASAEVHAGWQEPDPRTGRIPYVSKKIGGHAFAIVGYDEEGFWIQNSWDTDWGLNGFGHMTYDDWLENGYDCWVARTGVPTRSLVLEAGGPRLSRAQTLDYLPHRASVAVSNRPHLVSLGNDGELARAGRYRTDERDLDDIFTPTEGSPGTMSLSTAAANWSGTPRLVLYAHGGLNSQQDSAARIARMRPYFLANEIYPLHFMWDSDLTTTLKHAIQDVFRHPRFAGVWDDVKERFADLRDRAVELAVRGVGRPLWREMVENARGASRDRHGADLVAERIANYRLEHGDIELHLVGHSAGSELLSHLVPALELWGIPVKTLTLFAPACGTDTFRDQVLPHLGPRRTVERVTIFNLSEKTELADTVTSAYGKSLLYLVSNALESSHKRPLLGMQKYLGADDVLRDALGAPVKKGRRTVITSTGGPDVNLRSESKTHGGFDDDPHTLNSMLRIIRGKSQLLRGYPG